MEYKNGQIAINPRHNMLITALRTAVENGKGVPDKDATSHDDLFQPSGYHFSSGIDYVD